MLQEEHGISDLVLGIDHMATRILSGDREDALLEYMTMVPYYFWGAYNIMEMNSSTNVTRTSTTTRSPPRACSRPTTRRRTSTRSRTCQCRPNSSIRTNVAAGAWNAI